MDNNNDLDNTRLALCSQRNQKGQNNDHLGVAFPALCTLTGIFVGELLGKLLGVPANVGGVGIAMVLLILIGSYLKKRGLFNPSPSRASSSGAPCTSRSWSPWPRSRTSTAPWLAARWRSSPASPRLRWPSPGAGTGPDRPKS